MIPRFLNYLIKPRRYAVVHDDFSIVAQFHNKFDAAIYIIKYGCGTGPYGVFDMKVGDWLIKEDFGL